MYIIGCYYKLSGLPRIAITANYKILIYIYIVHKYTLEYWVYIEKIKAIKWNWLHAFYQDLWSRPIYPIIIKPITSSYSLWSDLAVDVIVIVKWETLCPSSCLKLTKLPSKSFRTLASEGRLAGSSVETRTRTLGPAGGWRSREGQVRPFLSPTFFQTLNPDGTSSFSSGGGLQLIGRKARECNSRSEKETLGFTNVLECYATKWIKIISMFQWFKQTIVYTFLLFLGFRFLVISLCSSELN